MSDYDYGLDAKLDREHEIGLHEFAEYDERCFTCRTTKEAEADERASEARG